MDQTAREKLLLKYDAPMWMQNLKNIPKMRIKASMENTPIERWYLSGVPEEFEVYIKRDDLTGCTLSGNKVRGLEFTFGDAISRGCASICSAGASQSNMMRTTALMAASLGMQAHFVVYTDKVHQKGNNMLHIMSGAYRYMIPNVDGVDFDKDLWPKVKLIADKVRKETGEPVYTHIFGGDNAYCFGYLSTFDELIKQDIESFSDIVIPCATGSSTFGIALGNHLNGGRTKVHALVTGESKTYATNEINKMLRYVGMQDSEESGISADDICEITEHLGDGYGETTPEEIDFLKKVAAQTGVILGSTYSGKAAYHLVKLLNEQPDKFKGKKILFVHTGGIFEMFDGRMNDAFVNDDNVKQWKDVVDEFDIQ